MITVKKSDKFGGLIASRLWDKAFKEARSRGYDSWESVEYADHVVRITPAHTKFGVVNEVPTFWCDACMDSGYVVTITEDDIMFDTCDVCPVLGLAKTYYWSAIDHTMPFIPADEPPF